MTAFAIAYDKDHNMNLKSLPPFRIIIFVKMLIPPCSYYA